MALIALTFQFAGIDSENDVKIGPEIFQRIPFFVELNRRRDAFETRKFRVIDDKTCGLQSRIAAVNDELAADHAQIRIGFVAISDVTRGKIGRIRLGVKRITCGVYTAES